MGAAILHTLFAQSAVGLHVLDTQLRVVRANALTDGVPAERLAGQYFTDAYRLERPHEAERMLRGVLDSGEAVRGLVVRSRLADGPGPDRSLKVSVHRLDDARGRTLGLLATVVDVDEQEKARTRAACLAAVRTRVGRSLDVTATCEGLVAAVVPVFADLAVVEVVDEVLRGRTRRRVRWGTTCRCAVWPCGGTVRTATGTASSARCAGCPPVRPTR